MKLRTTALPARPVPQPQSESEINPGLCQVHTTIGGGSVKRTGLSNDTRSVDRPIETVLLVAAPQSE